MEIERKYLVAEGPGDLHTYSHASIAQGYLVLGEEEVRVRRKGDRYVQTIKKGAGLQRVEVEIALTREQFDALWPLTQGRRVEKVRYDIPYQGHTIEFDVYGGALAGLLTAEVEFDAVEESALFTPPGWFGEDITDDLRYRNQHLAVYGLPVE